MHMCWKISGAKAVIVSTGKLATTLIPAVLRSGQCELVIGIDAMRIGQVGSFRFETFATLVAAPDRRCRLRRRGHEYGAERSCLHHLHLGTGGAPRGVMQHHGAILHNVEGATRIISEDFGWGDEIFLSFLPLSHAYEHTGGQHFPIGLGAQIYYAEGLEKLASNIEEVRPTIMVVVPRLFEVLRTRIAKAIEKQGALPTWLLERAQAIGARQAESSCAASDGPDALGDNPQAQDARPVRRADEGAGVGRCAAQPRGRQLLRSRSG